ncbi:MAG TPA: adenosylcobinamide-GDP ribazoletransferase, partial [Bacteroidia bacterium]|nr:adenosylcobinamide-GDP ribazoletransferase [Bacteroidia bacterium]
VYLRRKFFYKMKKEIKIFFTALLFFTRIPCPKWVDHAPDFLTKSSRYFPMVGIIVGTIGASIYYVCSYILPHPVAILLSMISTILTTGAFHEDGLGDMCDGFGGGWTKEKILLIMKDSRMGTYGIIGMMAVLSLKFVTLFYMDRSSLVIAIIAGHALSRFAACTLLYSLEYVRDEDQSKAKPAAQKMSITSLMIAALFGIAPLILFSNYFVFLTLIPVFIARWYLGNFFFKWIGGQTGDCGGATQQICEVVFYLSLLVLWKFI